MPRLLAIQSLLGPIIGVVLTVALADGQELGGRAGAFLERTVTPPEAGFGGIAFPFSNPAGAIFRDGSWLTRLPEPVATVTTSLLSDGQSFYAAGVGLPFGSEGGLSVGITSWQAGEYRGFTADDRPTGTFTSTDIAFSVGGGLSLGPASLGTTLRYLRSSLSGMEGGASGYALDLSTSFLFLDQVSMGFVLSNAAGELSWNEGAGPRERLPWRLRIGGGYVHPLEERFDTVRVDPTGIGRRKAQRPRTYLAAAIEGAVDEGGDSGVVGLGVEYAPSIDDLSLALHAGVDSRGDLGAGFNVVVPGSPCRADFSGRRDFGLGQIAWHVALSFDL